MLTPQAEQPEQSSASDPRADMYDLYLSNTKEGIIKQLADAGQAADKKARKADLVAQLYDAKTAPQAAQAPAAPPILPEDIRAAPGAPVPSAAASSMGMPPDPASVPGQNLLAQALRARLATPMLPISQMQPEQAIDPLQMRLRMAMGGR